MKPDGDPSSNLPVTGQEEREAPLATPTSASPFIKFPAWNSREVIGICVLLGALVFLVYGQTLRYEFVNYDDPPYVSLNPAVTHGLTLGGVRWAFTHKELGLWTPVVTMSHMLDYQLWGLHAGGHHLTNILLHLSSAILLFLILRQITGATWRSAFAAALFACHPLRVESVAWISERKDMLSGLFFMLSLVAYLYYIRRPGSMDRYLGILLLFALGLMCKPMLVTLPFVLLLLDYWPLNRLFQSSSTETDSAKSTAVNWRVIAEKIPLLALSIAWCAITLLGPKASISVETIPFGARMKEAPVWLVTYLGQMFWPTNLSVIYTHPEASLPWWPAALALFAILSFGVFLLRRRYPFLWMGWLWNLGMLVPVLGVVQISRHARADHYNYLPQIGLYIGITWVVRDLTMRWPHRRMVLGSTAVAVLCAFAVAARHQAVYWRNSITLWTHTIQCTQDNYIARNNLAMVLLQQGQTEEAIVQLHEALRITPAYVDALNNLGIGLLLQGRMVEGNAQLREALRINPAFADAHNNLGKGLFRQGRLVEAVAEFREALRINPDYADAHYNLSGALQQQGQTEEAIVHARKSVELQPNHPGFKENLERLNRIDK